jgi:ribosomal protein L11 methyltransferase
MSHGHWIAFDIAVPTDYQELLIAELSELGFEGYEQETDGLKAYIEEQKLDGVVREQVIGGVQAMGHGCHVRGEVRIEPRNWNEEWERTIEPMVVGRFWVYPSWTTETCPTDLIPLMIDPKQAFGTGYHETTRLILRMLPDAVQTGGSVVDVGTGTGILAIAALKLGAVTAFGFDIDEWSFDNAQENIWLNGVQERMAVSIGSFETVPQGATYDLVLANVIRDMLLRYAAEVVSLAKPGGEIVLSGLMLPDEGPIRSHPTYAALHHLQTTVEGEWCAIRYRKP